MAGERNQCLVGFTDLLGKIPYWLIALLARYYVARAFFLSGQTKLAGSEILGIKWNPFVLGPTPYILFEQEYKLNIFGTQYGMPFPETMARLSALGEFFLPILVMLGIFTRFGALGLLFMTGVIQLVYPNAWATTHLPWALALILIMARGPGLVSFDYALGLDRRS